MFVVIAVRAGVDQFAAQIRFHRGVRGAGRAGAEFDALLLQRRLGAAADAAADQHVDSLVRQQHRQRFVAAAVGTDDLRGYDLAVLDLVYLELFRVAEVLKHLAVFVSNCYFHFFSSINTALPESGTAFPASRVC